MLSGTLQHLICAPPLTLTLLRLLPRIFDPSLSACRSRHRYSLFFLMWRPARRRHRLHLIVVVATSLPLYLGGAVAVPEGLLGLGEG